MESLATLARAEVVVFFSILLALVGYRLLAGGINTSGLLTDKSRCGGGALSPERVQLLLVTLAVAGYILSELPAMRETRRVAVAVPELAYLLGGSQSVYLARKFLLTRRTPTGSREV
jgi:hypothetical protein